MLIKYVIEAWELHSVLDVERIMATAVTIPGQEQHSWLVSLYHNELHGDDGDDDDDDNDNVDDDDDYNDDDDDAVECKW